MSLPVLVPLGRCRNYWADSLRNLEQGNKARGLPLAIDGLTCNRYDHIAFRAIYDLDVPRPLYKTVFHLVRPAVSLKKHSMIEDAAERFSARCGNAEKKDVLSAIVRAATDVARSRQPDGPGETSNARVGADRDMGDSTIVGRAMGRRAMGDNSASLDRAAGGNLTKAFGMPMDGLTDAFGSTTNRRPTIAFDRTMDSNPTSAFGKTTNRDLSRALGTTMEDALRMTMSRRPTNALDGTYTPSKPARPGFSLHAGNGPAPAAGLPAELPAEDRAWPEDPLRVLDDKVKGLTIDTVREGRMPKGWAATCVEAGKATRKMALAEADLDASNQKRMVESVESISKSLRVLARAAAVMMLDDSDGG